MDGEHGVICGRRRGRRGGLGRRREHGRERVRRFRAAQVVVQAMIQIAKDKFLALRPCRKAFSATSGCLSCFPNAELRLDGRSACARRVIYLEGLICGSSIGVASPVYQ